MSNEVPTVTVVFLAYNRRDDLRISLLKTLEELDYPSERLDVIVVDNASTDGTSDMLARDFPGVRVLACQQNTGVSAWNEGFAIASGDYVLALDDDCYLPSDGLRRAVDEAECRLADLVSFGIVSSVEETHRFDLDEYLTGLLAFWGCAALFRRRMLAELGGFDPEIFIYAHELEFMLRFFDRGFRHLHLPEVVAVHMRPPTIWRGGRLVERPYRVNYRNWGYIAAKQLSPRDAVEALLALLAQTYREGRRIDKMAYRASWDTLKGFARGLRRRSPVRPEVSHTYRHNFETFSSPWWFSRTPSEIVRDVVPPGATSHANRGRREAWFADRARFYPKRAAVLEL
jgi:GT2 family glycosyltransferase